MQADLQSYQCHGLARKKVDSKRCTCSRVLHRSGQVDAAGGGIRCGGGGWTEARSGAAEAAGWEETLRLRMRLSQVKWAEQM
jgi:hypothetical protein